MTSCLSHKNLLLWTVASGLKIYQFIVKFTRSTSRSQQPNIYHYGYYKVFSNRSFSSFLIMLIVLVITHLFFFFTKSFFFHHPSHNKNQLEVDFDMFMVMYLVKTYPRDTNFDILLYIVRHYSFIIKIINKIIK